MDFDSDMDSILAENDDYDSPAPSEDESMKGSDDESEENSEVTDNSGDSESEGEEMDEA